MSKLLNSIVQLQYELKKHNDDIEGRNELVRAIALDEHRNRQIARVDEMRKRYKHLMPGAEKSDLFMDIERALTQLDIDEQEETHGKTTICQREGF